ncbi:MAG: bifunctional metallophosphatase/5'-nucleotidase [Prevotella sp.]|nr:bifunctional metallophosphatase/5'-nucleotidase [Prevotella sp.]
MRKWFILIAVALSISVCAMGAERTVRLRIVETSDVHGCFFPYDFVEGKPLKGSLARVSTYINRLRREYGDHLLLLDNGDILQGQPTCYWSNYVEIGRENIAAQVVNYMGYDVAAIGNHDVETGHAVYDKWIGELRCPVVGANIIDTLTNEPYVRPYVTFERDGVKIAVIGLLTPTIACWLNESLWSGLRFEEMTASARKWMQVVREQEKPDLVVGLFHSGKEGGLTLPGGIEEDATARVAREVPGFDIIFYGHDHIVHNEWILTSHPSSLTPDSVLTLDPSSSALNVADAQIELTIDGQGKVIRKNITGDIVSVRDEEVDRKMLSRFYAQMDSIKTFVGRRIGRFAEGATTRDSYFGSSAFTDFIHNVQLDISGADISFNAPLSFDSRIEPGDVTVADMFKLYRFENQYYVMNLTGSEIRRFLEESYARWVNTMTSADDHLLLLSKKTYGDQQRMGFLNYTFNFDSAAGIDYEVDVTKPVGQKVRILGMSDGTPFQEDRIYKVVMNSYRGNGGGDLLTKGAGIEKDDIDDRIIYQSPLDLRHYIMKYIEEKGTVTPRPNNNWRFIPEEWVSPAAARDRQLLFGPFLH